MQDSDSQAILLCLATRASASALVCHPACSVRHASVIRASHMTANLKLGEVRITTERVCSFTCSARSISVQLEAVDIVSV